MSDLWFTEEEIKESRESAEWKAPLSSTCTPDEFAALCVTFHFTGQLPKGALESFLITKH